MAATALTLLPAAVWAGTVTNTGPVAPEGIVEQTVADGTRYVQVRRTGTASGVAGQTFRIPGDGEMLVSGLALCSKMNRTYSSPSAFQIKLFEMDAVQPVDSLLLDTFSFDFTDLVIADLDWIVLDFGRTVRLRCGEDYGFLCYWDADSADSALNIRRNNQGVYGHGEGYVDATYEAAYWTDTDGQAWTGITAWPDRDLMFVIFAVPLPPPSGMVLLVR